LPNNAAEMEEARLLDQLREALASQYDVERVLGHGGMGMVVLGRDRALDRSVAIKVISPEIDVTPRHRQRFLQEARIVAKLRHPNIVAVYSAGEADGLLYFVMEYVPGESLRDTLARDRCCTTERAERILRDLADALAFAHARGVVHRDIKPENVLLDHDTGRAMLADFGVAQALAADGEQRLTGPGVVVGSPQYMSPEQAAGERDLDGRSDIYGLGLVGYEMLTGEPAFAGTSVVALLSKQLTEPPPPLGPRAPDAPPALVATITRALAKDADDRWQDASEMARALAGEIPVELAQQSEVPTPVAPPTAAPFGTASHPEHPRARPFVGPGRRPARAGRARRLATWLAGITAVLLFVAPFSWLARPHSARSGDVDLAASVLVAPLTVQSPDSALALGRRAGARTVVVGQVIHGTDSLRVVAATYDVATGQRVGEAYRSAPPDADPRLVFDALTRDILSNTSTQAGQSRETRP
jgi:eukaryotic-like serine/threonine-protein kinase